MSEQLDNLRTHLAIVKQSPQHKIEEEFYHLMLKAKDKLGQTSFHMAHFYYEYSVFILNKLESNIDIFNQQAVPANIQNQEQDELDDILQEFQDSAYDNQQSQNINENEANALEEKLEKGNVNGQEKGVNQQYKIQQNGQNKEGQIPNEQVAGQEQMDDKQICAINLQFAISIYESELQKYAKHESKIDEDQILNGLRRARTRLGDLLAIEQNYQRAVEEYTKVIVQEQPRKGGKHNRLISELYFLIGNCLLYDNKPQCQKQAITSYIKSVQILLNHLGIVQEYDLSGVTPPTLQKVEVDRFPFLNKVSDSDVVKEIKQVITCLLDKIQDTKQQIGVKKDYQAERVKQQQEKKKSQFKPVSQNVKVINLGSFGNRKRKPQVGQQNGQNPKPAMNQQLQKKLQKSQPKQKQLQQGKLGKQNSINMNNDSG